MKVGFGREGFIVQAPAMCLCDQLMLCGEELNPDVSGHNTNQTAQQEYEVAERRADPLPERCESLFSGGHNIKTYLPDSGMIISSGNR